MIRLLTTTFDVSDPAREIEYRKALDCNLENPNISEVLLLKESGSFSIPNHEKLCIRTIDQRPNYSHFIGWLDEIVEADDISIIANTDIYFDETLAAVTHTLQADECYALSRYDVQPDGSSILFDRNDSQDAWIFRGPIREELLADFPLGVPRCDNRFLYELQNAGYCVKNPAFSIRAHHLHAGMRTEYGRSGENFVDPPYGYRFPHNLLSAPSTIWHNLRYPDHTLGWRLDFRRISSTFPGRAIRWIKSKEISTYTG